MFCRARAQLATPGSAPAYRGDVIFTKGNKIL